MMIRTVLWSVLIAVVTFTSGCAINRATATVDPSADLDWVKSMYVKKLAADGRGIDVLIADRLKLRGYAAFAGDSRRPPWMPL